MKKYVAIVLALVMCLALLSGCGGTDTPKQTAESTTRTVTDLCGRTVTIPAKVTSVVCVNVGALRYTTYLGAVDLVKGVEENEVGTPCTKPFSYLHQDLFKTLPQTGNNGETYDEKIIDVNPDVIVAYLDADKADALQKKTGIPVVAIGMIEGILDDTVFKTINLLGEVYGKQDRAKELTDYLDGVKADIAKRVSTVPADKIPTVYVSGVSYKGSHGFEGTEAKYGPLAELKATNIADATGQTMAFNMDVEEVLKQNPDYMFVDTAGKDIIDKQYAQNPDFYKSFSAVKNGNVYSQISFRYNATNTELAIADMYYMATVIYPDAFKDLDPIAKANEIFETFLGVKDYYTTLSDAGYTFGKVTIGG